MEEEGEEEMKTIRRFCPLCYSIRDFTTNSPGVLLCDKGHTIREESLMKVKTSGDEG